MAETVFECLYRLSHENSGLNNTWKELYIDFPFTIRRALGDWIEEQGWDEACDDEELAQHLFDEMIRQLDGSVSGQLEDRNYYKRTLTMNFGEQPVHLAEIMTDILKNEKELLSSTMQGNQVEVEEEEEEVYAQDYSPLVRELHDMKQELELLRRKKTELYEELKKCEDDSQYMEVPPRTNHGAPDTKPEWIKFKTDVQTEIGRFSQEIAFKWQELYKKLTPLVEELLREVGKFRRLQELAYVKAHPASSVDRRLRCLNDWCGNVGKLIWDLIEYTSQVDMEAELEDSFRNVRGELTSMYKQFLSQTVIMTKQPSACMKMSSSKNGKSKEFELAIRILGAQQLHTNFTTTVGSAAVFSEAQCDTDGKLQKAESIKACSITWNKEKAKFDDEGSVKIPNVKLEQFNRPSKDDKNSERVCQQRYRIVVNLVMTLPGPQSLPLQVCSLPFIMNTGANQSCDAHGALLWYLFPDTDEAYGCHYQPPYPCIQELPVGSVMEMLNGVITAISPRRPLREDEMTYLSERLTGQSVQRDAPEVMVRIDRYLFDKISLPRAREQFPFWKWFTAITNLIENYVLEPWKDKVIHGFIGGQGAKAKLEDRPEGTFLLRFSESMVKGDSQNVCGGLVPTVRVPKNIDKSGVNSVLPLGAEYFQKSSLADLCNRPFTDKSSKGQSLMLKELYDNGRNVESALSKYVNENGDDINERYRKFRLILVLEPVTSRMSRMSLRTNARESTSDSSPLQRQASMQSQASSSGTCPGISPGTPAGLVLGDSMSPRQAALHDRGDCVMDTSAMTSPLPPTPSPAYSGAFASPPSVQSVNSDMDSILSNGGAMSPPSVTSPSLVSAQQLAGSMPLAPTGSTTSNFQPVPVQRGMTSPFGSSGGTVISKSSVAGSGPQLLAQLSLSSGTGSGGSSAAAPVDQPQVQVSARQLLELLQKGCESVTPAPSASNIPNLHQLIPEEACRLEPQLTMQLSEEEMIVGELSQNDVNLLVEYLEANSRKEGEGEMM